MELSRVFARRLVSLSLWIWITLMNSRTRADLPTPASPLMKTTLPGVPSGKFTINEWTSIMMWNTSRRRSWQIVTYRPSDLEHRTEFSLHSPQPPWGLVISSYMPRRRFKSCIRPYIMGLVLPEESPLVWDLEQVGNCSRPFILKYFRLYINKSWDVNVCNWRDINYRISRG